MATEEIVPKEVLDAISATCDMITVADKYAMINNNKEFKLYEDDTISAGSNISTPLSKDILDGGYGNITHYTTNDGENIFIVPNEDGSTRIIANSDEYLFVEGKVDFIYAQNSTNDI
ncbi:hypothetical protein CRU98_00840 [Arcobacter sp. CECT 8986]|uniref:hypothetical protein n=1 Tax=Arcobacter sp. CECT 8986 TaxID=2044507 RepID=UPI001009BDD9|nr:hypothetical protein [Arcobacter sp. CECT 8986]RXK01031.1 hypothetical protein CRU98_00840 [Arcobacter sp. CECT 8986]